MSRCPFATWDPVEVGDHERSIRPAGVVMHTAVSDSDALRPWSGIEWHFYVGREGQITQYRDTEVEADAQMDGNYFDGWGHVSIETWDGAGDVWQRGDTEDIPPWTAEQVEAIGRLLGWLHEEHGVPLRRIRKWNGRGVGYHRQFTAESYPRWNESHACPGDRRVAQIDDLIRTARGEEDDDMPSAQDVADAVWEHRFPNLSQNEVAGEATARWFLQNMEEAQDAKHKETRQRLAKVQATVNGQQATIDKLVDMLGTDGAVDVEAIKAELRETIRQAVESVDIEATVGEEQS